MEDKSWHEVVTPPDTLKKKIGGRLRPNPVAIERAQDALQDLEREYRDWIRRDLEQFVELMEGIKTKPAASAAGLEAIAHLAHDVKGQAGTFGFPLLSLIAESLRDFVTKVDVGEERHLDLLQTHLDAMHIVVRDDIRGNGGAAGEELVRRLAIAVHQVIA